MTITFQLHHVSRQSIDEGSGVSSGKMERDDDWDERASAATWSCFACTYENRSESRFCEMCGSRYVRRHDSSTVEEDIVEDAAIDKSGNESSPLINTLRSERSVASVEAMEVEEDKSLIAK